jgi:hypothetical protein
LKAEFLEVVQEAFEEEVGQEVALEEVEPQVEVFQVS